MEVPNGQFDAEKFIEIVKEFLMIALSHLQGHILSSELVGFDSVHGVEAVLTGWMI